MNLEKAFQERAEYLKTLNELENENRRILLCVNGDYSNYYPMQVPISVNNHLKEIAKEQCINKIQEIETYIKGKLNG